MLPKLMIILFLKIIFMLLSISKFAMQKMCPPAARLATLGALGQVICRTTSRAVVSRNLGGSHGDRTVIWWEKPWENHRKMVISWGFMVI